MSVDRRGWIVGGVGVLAAVAGAVSAWRRHIEPAAPAAPPDARALWALRFERPEGGELVMAQWQGRPLLVNFWATWCPPCVRELPEIDRFAAEFTALGGQVLGLALDRPQAVREFLERVRLRFPIGIAGIDGTDLVHQMGNPQGALPYSVLLDASGRVRQRKLGQTQLDELRGWAQELQA